MCKASLREHPNPGQRDGVLDVRRPSLTVAFLEVWCSIILGEDAEEADRYIDPEERLRVHMAISEDYGPLGNEFMGEVHWVEIDTSLT